MGRNEKMACCVTVRGDNGMQLLERELKGRLEPLQSRLKKNKHGMGAEKTKKKVAPLPDESVSNMQNDKEHFQAKKKAKALSKRVRKLKEQEECLQEKGI